MCQTVIEADAPTPNNRSQKARRARRWNTTAGVVQAGDTQDYQFRSDITGALNAETSTYIAQEYLLRELGEASLGLSKPLVSATHPPLQAFLMPAQRSAPHRRNYGTNKHLEHLVLSLIRPTESRSSRQRTSWYWIDPSGQLPISGTAIAASPHRITAVLQLNRRSGRPPSPGWRLQRTTSFPPGKGCTMPIINASILSGFGPFPDTCPHLRWSQ